MDTNKLNINIKTTNLELTEALRTYAEDKIGQIQRHFGKDPINIDIELEYMPAHHSGPVFRCEINVEMPGQKSMLRADSTESDMYAAIDTCIPKIKEQLDKQRDRRDTRIRRGGRAFKEMLRRFWE